MIANEVDHKHQKSPTPCVPVQMPGAGECVGLGAGIFEKPLNVQLSQMVPEIQKTLGIALSQRSSRELSKSFEIFEKSSLSSKIQVLKVDSFSKIPGSSPGFIPSYNHVFFSYTQKVHFGQ